MNFSDAPFTVSKKALLSTLQSIPAPTMSIRATADEIAAYKTYCSERIAMFEAILAMELSEVKSRSVCQPDGIGLGDFMTEAASGPDGLFEQIDTLAAGASDPDSDWRGLGLRFGSRIGRAA